MIQPKIQEVYVPTDNYTLYTVKVDFGFDVVVDKKELITFTPEEFEQFKREFGKELLEKAADNAKLLQFYFLKCEDPDLYYKYEDEENSYIHRDTYGIILGLDTVEVDKESITSTLDDYLLNNKI